MHPPTFDQVLVPKFTVISAHSGVSFLLLYNEAHSKVLRNTLCMVDKLHAIVLLLARDYDIRYCVLGNKYLG